MSLSQLAIAVISATAVMLSCNARAEMGTGTVQDPVSYQYTNNVYKDWQEGIVLDPGTGSYIITYKVGDGDFVSIVFEPATKITPTLRSTFQGAEDGGAIRYRYTLGNDRASKQGIEMFRITVSSIDGKPDAVGHWKGSVAPNLVEGGQFVSWSCSRNDDEICTLLPGDRQSGFLIESNDLPGIAVARVWGDARPATWLDQYEPSTPVGQQIEALTTTNNYVGRLTVAPLIPVPTPFNGASVLSSIQKHIDTDLVKLGLIDPGFASELDRWFQAAVSAAGLGNLSALRSDLNELHRLLEREHKHKGFDRDDDGRDDQKERGRGQSGLIDRLAARMLSFDLKYVERRMLAKADRRR